MGNKIKKKNKSVLEKIIGNQKNYLLNIIKHLEGCVEYNKGNVLSGYFQRQVDLNKQLLKELK